MNATRSTGIAITSAWVHSLSLRRTMLGGRVSASCSWLRASCGGSCAKNTSRRRIVVRELDSSVPKKTWPFTRVALTRSPIRPGTS